MSIFTKFPFRENRLRWFLIFLWCIFLGVALYVLFQHFFSEESPTEAVEESIVTASTQDFSNEIIALGKAELANEQKLRFLQSGKVSEVYVAVGDSVKKGDVLASLDKREFFEQAKQLQTRIAATQKSIDEEKNKASGIEGKKMARDIASTERKLKEAEEELSKLLQSAPDRAEEKKIELNAKKRELEVQKAKYDLDAVLYEKELANKDELIKARIDDAKKWVVNTIQLSKSSTVDIWNLWRDIGALLGFDDSEKNEKTKNLFDFLYYFDHSFDNAKYQWEDLKNTLKEYETLVKEIRRDSLKASDAEQISRKKLSIYKKFLEILDTLKIAVNNAPKPTEIDKIDAEDIEQLEKKISALRSTVFTEISSLQDAKTNFLVQDSDDKITKKFLQELAEKKLALSTLADTIAKNEIAIRQDERNLTITQWGIVFSDAIQKEVTEKQSVIADIRDDLFLKKEEYQKLLSGKSPALENLYNTLREQRGELEKHATKEESYEIRSPFVGTIRTIKVKVGDVVSGDASGEKWILLENSDIINVKVALNQLDIIKVKIGQKARVTFEAVEWTELEGKIVEISSTPIEENPSGGGGPSTGANYEVIVAAERENHPIYSGMNAKVSLQIGESKKALVVPSTALFQNKNGENMVKAKNAQGQFLDTPVSIGDVRDGMTEILSGLQENQEIKMINFDVNTYTHKDFTSAY